MMSRTIHHTGRRGSMTIPLALPWALAGIMAGVAACALRTAGTLPPSQDGAEDTPIDTTLEDGFCVPVEESCNGRDDDCNGVVDDGCLVLDYDPACGYGNAYWPMKRGNYWRFVAGAPCDPGGGKIYSVMTVEPAWDLAFGGRFPAILHFQKSGACASFGPGTNHNLRWYMPGIQRVSEQADYWLGFPAATTWSRNLEESRSVGGALVSGDLHEGLTWGSPDDPPTEAVAGCTHPELPDAVRGKLLRNFMAPGGDAAPANPLLPGMIDDSPASPLRQEGGVAASGSFEACRVGLWQDIWADRVDCSDPAGETVSWRANYGFVPSAKVEELEIPYYGERAATELLLAHIMDQGESWVSCERWFFAWDIGPVRVESLSVEWDPDPEVTWNGCLDAATRPEALAAVISLDRGDDAVGLMAQEEFPSAVDGLRTLSVPEANLGFYSWASRVTIAGADESASGAIASLKGHRGCSNLFYLAQGGCPPFSVRESCEGERVARTFILSPRAATEFDLEDMSDPSVRSSPGSGFSGSLEVRSTGAISMLTQYTLTGGTTAVYGSRAPRAGSRLLVPALFNNTYGFNNSISLYNPSPQTALVVMYVRAQDGVPLGTLTELLEPGRSVLVLPFLRELPPAGSLGSMEITSCAEEAGDCLMEEGVRVPVPIVAVSNESALITGGTLARGYDVPVKAHAELAAPCIFAHHGSEDLVSSLALMNPGETTASVDVEYLSELGGILESQSFTVPPKGTCDLFPSAIGTLTGQVVSMTLSSDADLAAVVYIQSITEDYASAYAVEPPSPLDGVLPVPSGHTSAAVRILSTDASGSASITVELCDKLGSVLHSEVMTLDPFETAEALLSLPPGEPGSVALRSPQSASALLIVRMPEGMITAMLNGSALEVSPP